MSKDKVTVRICPECGSIMIPSFCLPYKEFVCVPCGTGEEFFNNCERKEVDEHILDDLRNKYQKDIHKISLQTAKNGGGQCRYCGLNFNCDKCKEIESHTLEYWGKGIEESKTNESI